MGGQSPHMPLKVNAGGVIPVIFRLFDPGVSMSPCCNCVGQERSWLTASLRFHRAGRAAALRALRGRGIIFFLLLYSESIFNPNEAADNMRKYGGFIPGIRRGATPPTTMNEIRPRSPWWGASNLSILCVIPDLMISGIKLQHLPAGRQLGGYGVYIGALRFLLEGLNVQFTSRHIAADRGGRGHGYGQPDRSQLIMRHYDGYASFGPDSRQASTFGG